MKAIITVLILWAIAIAATIFIVNDSAVIAYLGPVYTICMIGSVIAIRKALKEKSD